MQRRYARHVMLTEVGEAGQGRLSAATVSVEGPGSDVAAQYLRRAGVTVREGGPPAPSVAVEPGRPELREAAAFLSGAWTALEAMKRTLGVGRPPAPEPVSLTGPDEG